MFGKYRWLKQKILSLNSEVTKLRLYAEMDEGFRVNRVYEDALDLVSKKVSKLLQDKEDTIVSGVIERIANGSYDWHISQRMVEVMRNDRYFIKELIEEINNYQLEK